MTKPKLTHLDAAGQAHMVDVGAKPITRRVALARGRLLTTPEVIGLIQGEGMPKGDVLATARLAGIQAAKRTFEWIPLCHPLPLDALEIELRPDAAASRVWIEAQASAHAKTGVEMEALVAVAAAGLTVYDMCKAVDRGMTIDSVHLVSKEGGKSGAWTRPDDPLGGSPSG